MKNNRKKINNLYNVINNKNISFTSKTILNNLFIKFTFKTKKNYKNVISKNFKYLRVLNLK
ncbi:hypothetical protein TpMuguga_05g00027 (apicoplast) [Theileria parva strain Muguga]|uniref:Uncharacterized protein n=1 Tax=Theileria parva TaxID=5875 RepID=Q4MY96_THEPA|nr:hypothetical protein TpMuguga_05g00027 [Theileria parva strain Muguga]|eukprot:XP_762696.1 hypothetical protein (apicoplast) [Theileria parva strain Muguga]